MRKIIIIFIVLLMVFLSGFFIGRLKPFKTKDIQKIELVFKDDIKIEDLRNISSPFIDSANNELINYYTRYLYKHSNLLPDKYISYSRDTIEFNKENFFYYYSMYKITDYLSNAKSCIINSLIIESTKDTLNILDID